MEILIRKNGGNWESAKEVHYPREEDLQMMLYESPNLIPVRGDRDSRAVFIREAGLRGSGSTDLLGVDIEGNIYVVECKLASNTEIRRKVIGQVLEYAAFLWNMSYEDLDQLFIRREGKSLVELLSSKVKTPESLENFRRQVSENLKAGRFDLMIAVDAINEELERIIQYLASCGSGIRLEAIELNLFRAGETEIMVPEIHGREIQEASQNERARTIEQVLESCSDETCRSRLHLMVSEWKNLGNEVVPGTKGFSFRAQLGEALRPVFWAYPEYVCVNFGFLAQEGLSQNSIEEYKGRIARTHGFDPSKVAIQGEPRALLKSLSEKDVKDVVTANNDLVLQWRKLHP